MSQENLQSNKPLIIYGPEGCGKTRYAQAPDRHFGKEIIIDLRKIGRFCKTLAEGIFIGLIIGAPVLLYGLGWIKG